jgi:hypothetical protein
MVQSLKTTTIEEATKNSHKFNQQIVSVKPIQQEEVLITTLSITLTADITVK